MKANRPNCAASVRYFSGPQPCAFRARGDSQFCGLHERQRRLAGPITCHCCTEPPQLRPISPTHLVWQCACPLPSEHARNQAREIASLLDAVRRKNLQLDALHYVWCSGACEGGSHRHGGELTREIVEEAERNTRRLRARWESLRAKEERR